MGLDQVSIRVLVSSIVVIIVVIQCLLGCYRQLVNSLRKGMVIQLLCVCDRQEVYMFVSVVMICSMCQGYDLDCDDVDVVIESMFSSSMILEKMMMGVLWMLLWFLFFLVVMKIRIVFIMVFSIQFVCVIFIWCGDRESNIYSISGKIVSCEGLLKILGELKLLKLVLIMVVMNSVVMLRCMYQQCFISFLNGI